MAEDDNKEGNVIELTELNFEEEVFENNDPIFIDFWAEWCFPCKKLSPVYAELADEFKKDEKLSKVRFAKLNIDENSPLMDKLREKDITVMSIPQIILFSQKGFVDKIQGFMGKDRLKENMLKILEKVLQ